MNCNTIINYILIIYELSNFDQVHGLVSQTRDSGGNRIHDSHGNSLAHYSLEFSFKENVAGAQKQQVEAGSYITILM